MFAKFLSVVETFVGCYSVYGIYFPLMVQWLDMALFTPNLVCSKHFISRATN